ncbi:MAG: ATP-binding cassette domain-containing protein [Victivallaceae bacterium]
MWVVQGEDIVVKGSFGGSKPILKKVSFALEEGRVTLFIGKSGSGKTTLLRSIVGLNVVDSGNIIVRDKQRVGFVSQSYDLFSHMTVLKNCVHPQIKVKNENYDIAVEKAMEFLKFLEIEDLVDCYPDSLSGGQRQRVAIARTLSMDSKIVLFDEPTAALDPYATEAFADLVKHIVSHGVTVGMSVHDMLLVNMCLDTVYLLDNGRIVNHFSVDDCGKPAPDSLIHQYLNKGDRSPSSENFN